MPCADRPFRVMEKVNDNAYKLDVPKAYNVSPTFNVRDLFPYLEDSIGVEDNADLRANPFQQGEDDVPHHDKTMIEEQEGHYKEPITCSRANLVNLVVYLGCTEECGAQEAVEVEI